MEPRPVRRHVGALLVPVAVPRRAVGPAGHLRLGRDVRRDRSGAGLDARQLRAHDPRGQAPRRGHRQRCDCRGDLRRVPHPADRNAVRRRGVAVRHGRRALRLHRPGPRPLAAAPPGAGGRRRRPRARDLAARPVRPARGDAADRPLALPAGDCRGHSPVVVRDRGRRLAVQGGGARGDPRPRPARGVLRQLQLLGGPAVAGAAAPAHVAAAPAPRPRLRALRRARRPDDGVDRLPGVRDAGGGGDAPRQRPGAALLDRPAHGGTAVPAGAPRIRPSR